MNYFDFLFDLRNKFKLRIQTFLDEVLLPKFSEESFVFDVYLPPPHEKVWLVDINPWAPRTDPLLFSWLELLRMEEPGEQTERKERIVRLRISPQNDPAQTEEQNEPFDGQDEDGGDSESDDDVQEVFEPEFRLVQRDDPEAYQFASTKYSAHKMPRDVVDASMTPSGMKDMMEEWKRVMEGEGGDESDDEG